MQFLLSPWLMVGLVSYAIAARVFRFPYRWIGLVAIILLLGAAYSIGSDHTALAETLANASYRWFASFTIALIISTVFARNKS